MSLQYQFDPLPQYFRKYGWLKPKLNGDHHLMATFLMWTFGRCSTQPQVIYHDHKEMLLEPFEFIFGRRMCSVETGISEQTLRTMINQLNSGVHGKILEKSTSKSTSKFSVYRWSTAILSESSNQQINQQVTSNQPATNHKLRAKEELALEIANLATPSYEQPETSVFETCAPAPPPPEIPAANPEKLVAFSSLLSDNQKVENEKTFMLYAVEHDISFKDYTMRRWFDKFPFPKLMEGLKLLIKKVKRGFENGKPIKHPEALMQTILDENWVEELRLIDMNRKFAKDFRSHNNWNDLTITKDYCRDEYTGSVYHFWEPRFQEELTRKYRTLYEAQR